MTTNATARRLARFFPERLRRSHKGDFGRLCIVAGSRGMVGCTVLAAQGALRTGVGLLTVAFPSALYPVLTKHLLEPMFLPLPETRLGALSAAGLREVLLFAKTQDVVAVGPGLGRSASTQDLVRKFICRCAKPFVLDADGLFAFSGSNVRLLKACRQNFILTPHAGEFARLFGPVGNTDELRRKAALKAAKSVGGVVVLKGHHTVVASPAGDLFVNPTGNPGLAKGGTGDVLFGMIASLFAQGLRPFDAASLGVFLHGLAADIAVKKIAPASLLASDVVGHISSAIRKVKSL